MERYKRSCINCRNGSCGNIINNQRISFCRHPWGETDPDKLHPYAEEFISDETKRLRQPGGIPEETLAEEIDCPNHEWDMYHPASRDHQPKLFEESK